MKIEIWSDPVCIFSYIGNHRLRRVLYALNLENSIVLEWHSFVIAPHFLQSRKSSSVIKYYKRILGISQKKAKLLCQDLDEILSSEGLSISFEKIVPCNTYNSHRLLKMAHHYKLQTELMCALFNAHFVEGRDISDISVLAEIGESVGIPQEDILQMYEGYDYMIEVRRDMERAHRLKFFHTPGLFIDGKVSLIGNHYEEQIADLIITAYQQYCRKCYAEE
jgi:predicted DsbA family dithiol-disulfide isomerase